MSAPQAKRPRLQEQIHPSHHSPQAESQIQATVHSSHYYSVTDCVLRRSDQLLESIELSEILNASLNPALTFLTSDEIEKLRDPYQASRRLVASLLYLIKGRRDIEERDEACRILVACIVKTREEHRGHRELEKIFRYKLPKVEWEKIECLLREVDDSPLPSPYKTPRGPQSQTTPLTPASVNTESPERPVQLIQLQGQLVEKYRFNDERCEFKGRLGEGHGFKGRLGEGHGFKGKLGERHGFKGRLGEGHGFKGRLGEGHGFKGQLGERYGFPTIERDLWESFSRGNYEKLEATVRGVQADSTFLQEDEVDCQIVAKWFNSLIIMHKDGEYTMAIKELNDALEMCNQETCVNVTILQGRIYQRIAQNYLMLDLKDPAMMFFAQAKDRLQMVGRGYDKANMFCREAKVMSALEPERRGEIEGLYELALCVLEKDDPFFLASFPSITLSKAAFYLRVSFGSKASKGGSLPHVHPEDISKAKQTLDTIVEKDHIHLEMRQAEYSFLVAELCRLQGREVEAKKMFTALTSTPGSSKVKNILSLAEQRLLSIGSEVV